MCVSLGADCHLFISKEVEYNISAYEMLQIETNE